MAWQARSLLNSYQKTNGLADIPRVPKTARSIQVTLMHTRVLYFAGLPFFKYYVAH
jgi:hypothetical protein